MTKSPSVKDIGHRWRERMMAGRMNYLSTVVRELKAELSTEEFIRNPKILRLLQLAEFQLREMERAYVRSNPTSKI